MTRFDPDPHWWTRDAGHVVPLIEKETEKHHHEFPKGSRDHPLKIK